jgi:hypothetical protein
LKSLGRAVAPSHLDLLGGVEVAAVIPSGRSQIAPELKDGAFDLIGPHGFILPSLWEQVIQPGWEVQFVFKGRYSSLNRRKEGSFRSLISRTVMP